MPSTRKILAIIGEHIRARGEEGDLWDALTALRGPDNSEMNEYKSAITGVIRAAIVQRVGYYGFVICDDTHDFLAMREGLSQKMMNDREFATRNHHFVAHAQQAFRSLGLDWFSVNPDVVEPVKKEKKRATKPKAATKRKPSVQRGRKR